MRLLRAVQYCSDVNPIVLCACYALSSTVIYTSSCAKSGTATTLPLVSYALAMRCPIQAYSLTLASTLSCYAPAMRCPVLRSSMSI
eukprot:2332883-Rhodomonas_salina.2